MVDSKEYQDHPIFGDLDYFVQFYGFMADRTAMYLATGLRSVLSLDTYVFSSIQGTLESISILLRAGMMNDAYALLRKYHDAAIIHAYTACYLEAHYCVDEVVVERIEGWRTGKTKAPGFRSLLDYLGESTALATVNHVLAADKRYRKLRDRCNSHVHYNHYAHMVLNVRKVYVESRTVVLGLLRKDLRDILVLHLAYMFTIKYAYLSSSDYIDALECGLVPEEGSQFWVAPLIQEMFNKYITPWRPDVTDAIKSSSMMELK